MTRTATRSCRDPETRMSFLVASWRPPQAAAFRGRRHCRYGRCSCCYGCSWWSFV